MSDRSYIYMLAGDVLHVATLVDLLEQMSLREAPGVCIDTCAMVIPAVLQNGIVASPSAFWYVQSTCERVMQLISEIGLAHAICGSFAW